MLRKFPNIIKSHSFLRAHQREVMPYPLEPKKPSLLGTNSATQVLRQEDDFEVKAMTSLKFSIIPSQYVCCPRIGDVDTMEYCVLWYGWHMAMRYGGPVFRTFLLVFVASFSYFFGNFLTVALVALFVAISHHFQHIWRCPNFPAAPLSRSFKESENKGPS